MPQRIVPGPSKSQLILIQLLTAEQRPQNRVQRPGRGLIEQASRHAIHEEFCRFCIYAQYLWILCFMRALSYSILGEEAGDCRSP